jgi:hypothetical protein
MALAVAVPALIGVAVTGFGAGLFSFRVKSRWCAQCGQVKRCPACASATTVDHCRHIGVAR